MYDRNQPEASNGLYFRQILAKKGKEGLVRCIVRSMTEYMICYCNVPTIQNRIEKKRISAFVRLFVFSHQPSPPSLSEGDNPADLSRALDVAHASDQRGIDTDHSS